MKDTGIKFETLRKGFNFKKIFIGLVVIVAIGSVIILKGSKANYTYEQIIPFAEGEVHIKKYDFKIMAMYQQKDKSCTNNDSCYQEITTNRMPSDGYKINESKSGCYKDSNKEQKDNEAKLYTNENGEHVINNLLKEDKCYLYFDIDNRPKTGLQIAKAKSKGAMPEITGPACNANTNNSSHNSGSCKMTESGVYTTQDDQGTSYVYRGTVDNNWVKFGTTGTQTGKGDPIWWRIIRVNGDGSVLIVLI